MVYKYNVGIYEIRCIPLNKRYIGASYNLKRRFREHRHNLEINGHRRKQLQNDFNKFGFDNFEFNIVLLCNSDNLSLYEKQVIDFYMNENSLMYNTNRDYYHSTKKVIQKISENVSGENNKRGMLGKNHSAKAKQQISEARRGSLLSDETKRRMSESTKGENNPNFGVPMSEEQKKKISEKMRGENNPKAQLGKLRSDDTKKKLSNAAKNRKKVTCEYCRKEIPIPNYYQHHGENCKYKPDAEIESLKQQLREEENAA